MTDKSQSVTPKQPVDVTAVAFGDSSGVTGAGIIAVEGNSAVLVARFDDMDAAKAAYGALIDAESKRAIDIEGKIHIQKMTDHSTRTGFAWCAVAGGVIGLIFPPTILAGAVTVGIAGAIAGKAGNELKKGAVAAELADVITPGTSGIVALVAITAVDLVKATIPQATAVEVVPVSDETADAVKAAAKSAGAAAG